MQNRDRDLGRIIVHVLLGVYGAVLLYILLGLIVPFKVSVDVFFGLSFALLFFTLGQSIYELGARKAFVFLIITGAIGFLAEVLGTNSGFPFGRYYYTNYLGQKVLGVPIVVPLVWFVITYICLSIASGNVASIAKNRSTLLKIAFLSAFGAVAWDFLIDPMFSSYGYWIWTGQFLPLPELNGIPLTNFVGWFVLVAIMVIICIYAIPSSGRSLVSRKNTLDSIIAYAMLMIDGIVANYTLGNLDVIALGTIAMLSFVALSVRRLSINQRKLETVGVAN